MIFKFINLVRISVFLIFAGTLHGGEKNIETDMNFKSESLLINKVISLNNLVVYFTNLINEEKDLSREQKYFIRNLISNDFKQLETIINQNLNVFIINNDNLDRYMTDFKKNAQLEISGFLDPFYNKSKLTDSDETKVFLKNAELHAGKIQSMLLSLDKIHAEMIDRAFQKPEN